MSLSWCLIRALFKFLIFILIKPDSFLRLNIWYIMLKWTYILILIQWDLIYFEDVWVLFRFIVYAEIMRYLSLLLISMLNWWKFRGLYLQIIPIIVVITPSILIALTFKVCFIFFHKGLSIKFLSINFVFTIWINHIINIH